jgi:hypothetical protein
MPATGAAIMKSIIFSAFTLFVLTGMSVARELPDAPSTVAAGDAYFVEAPVAVTPVTKVFEKKPIDATFLSLTAISIGSTFADSYTTLFARQNYLAGKTGVCNMEVESAYLYGTHPTVGRAYAVASAKSAGSILAAYYLRKHHNRFWSAPLVSNSILSLQGVTQNMRACN